MSVFEAIIITLVFTIVFGVINYGGILEYKDLKMLEGSKPIDRPRILKIVLMLTAFNLFGVFYLWYMVWSQISFE